jgi:hypothetical protein
MNLPIDLPREVAERAQRPGFDAVVDRARGARRRRRTTIASGLAAVVVVAGVGFAVGRPGAGDDQRPGPARPGPSTPWDGTSEVDPDLPADVRAILGEDEVHPWAINASGDGIAVLWRACPSGSATTAGDNPCRFALVTREGGEVVGVEIADAAPRLSPVPGGWLLETNGRFDIVFGGGERSAYETGPGNGDVMAGDTVVETSEGIRLLRGDKVIPGPVPPDGTLQSAYVTPEGRFVGAVTTRSGTTVVSTDNGRSWEQRLVPSSDEPVASAAVVGNGDHVAVAFLGDDPDGSIPVVEVWRSADAGEQWSLETGSFQPGALASLSGLAVSAAGTTYFTTQDTNLVRVDEGGNAQLIAFSSSDTSVFAVDDSVCVLADKGPVDRLQCSADDGKTWAPQPLPGFS